MRRERGEPGGFGLEEGFSLALLAFFLPGVFFVGIVVLVTDVGGVVSRVSDGLWNLLPF
jgi:hypothetical protein